MAKQAQSSPTKITAKEAAGHARKHLVELLGSVMSLSLEEVEMNEDRSRWLITLGFVGGTESALFGFGKKYKLFEVDAHTGEVLAMRIRSV